MLSQAPQALCLVSEAKLGRTHKKKSVRLLNSKTVAPKTVLEVKAKRPPVVLQCSFLSSFPGLRSLCHLWTEGLES